jgi:hypothetical protein
MNEGELDLQSSPRLVALHLVKKRGRGIGSLTRDEIHPTRPASRHLRRMMDQQGLAESRDVVHHFQAQFWYCSIVRCQQEGNREASKALRGCRAPGKKKGCLTQEFA